jgi:antitoxin PrlF
MSAATLTTKGQITLPKQVRDTLGLEIGDQIDFVMQPDGRYAVVPVKSSIKSLKGCIPKPAKALSAGDMKGAIGKRAALQAMK